MKSQGIEEDRLQLLRDVSGAFRPGILTALVGVSGAGKTTLMDVLAGRKTSGYIEGSISISGYPKNQATFARVSGYCEQNDIHSPNVTVYESLLYSAWMRLAKEITKETRQASSFDTNSTFYLLCLYQMQSWVSHKVLHTQIYRDIGIASQILTVFSLVVAISTSHGYVILYLSYFFSLLISRCLWRKSWIWLSYTH